MADQEIIDLNLTEDVMQEIASMAFSAAQPASIRFVRRLTRKIIAVKAAARDIIDLQDSVLNSPAELAAIANLRTAFSDFEATANLAITKAQLATAWTDYQTAVGLV